MLNHPNTSDELRRETESKLLRMKQLHLFSIPVDDQHKEEKARLAVEVEELINGIVLLKIPDEAAWMLSIESKDAARIGESHDDKQPSHYPTSRTRGLRL